MWVKTKCSLHAISVTPTPKAFSPQVVLAQWDLDYLRLLGQKMGAPERTVCFFTGDGGLQMTIQELGTIMEYGTDVKIILLNNNFLGNVRQWQELFFQCRFSQTPMINPDFVAIAKAYGIAAENVETRDQLDDAIARMLNHKGAYMLNVNIDYTDMIFPMTPPGAGVDTIMLNATEMYQID